MSAALHPTVKHAITVDRMSKGRVVKGIEQTWCRASKSARGDGKFAANAVTPLQYASAEDSPPTTLIYFRYFISVLMFVVVVVAEWVTSSLNAKSTVSFFFT